MAFGARGRKGREPNRPYCGAVVPAAGQGMRMEGQGKLFYILSGVPLIVHTLLALNACVDIDEIVAVARPEDIVRLSHLCQAYEIAKVRHIVCGGEKRPHSVLAGLMALPPEAELVAVHDAARPFLTTELASRVIRLAARTGAAVPCVPSKDTVKRVFGDRVLETVERHALMLVQTPQAFNTGLLKGALAKAIRENWEVTDDCGAVERMGMSIFVTEGSYRNFKVTTPEDLIFAQALVEAQK